MARGGGFLQRIATALFALALTLVCSTARAREEYPGELQAAIGMECAAPCQTCHISPNGGRNWNKFGLRLIGPVLGGASWPDVVAGLRQADADTDGDGRLDIYELEHDTDPSLAGNDGIDCVRYGCGARIAGQGEADRLAIMGDVVMLATLLALVRLRSRPRSRSRS